MKTFILVLILGFAKGKPFGSQCFHHGDYVADIRCGILPHCYQGAPNGPKLDYYSCKRREMGLPDFVSRIKGYCPYDKPHC